MHQRRHILALNADVWKTHWWKSVREENGKFSRQQRNAFFLFFLSRTTERPQKVMREINIHDSKSAGRK